MANLGTEKGIELCMKRLLDKKIMTGKKLVGCILAVSMMVTGVPANVHVYAENNYVEAVDIMELGSEDDNTAKDWDYYELEDGTIGIERYKGTDLKITIPDMIDEKK